MTSSKSVIYNQQSYALRQSLRIKRRHLPKMKQHQHAKRISQRIIHSKFYKHSRHIALYLSADGEVDLSFLINKLHGHSKKCYLPVILSRRHAIMYFAPYDAQTQLKKNCFGILEPIYQKKQLKTAQQMDLVLAPLVGFDEQGNRMGMGGGYYDRALQHLKSGDIKSRALKPKFVGIAHEIQRVKKLESHTWDIALNAIVTERR
ncbi:MAG: 5-formyltetrahydrofolate cyclo-ligase, partial [gamma proteobacterium symbiont of Bathyaustriella thionipta]|nr:5-formyltetrahydrofolate cyclo-ligase [gamma proteobacterium symbiont of Bathyaustriella thionipta]